MLPYLLALMALISIQATAYGARQYSQTSPAERPGILLTKGGAALFTACEVATASGAVGVIYLVSTKLGWLDLFGLFLCSGVLWMAIEKLLQWSVGPRIRAFAQTGLMYLGTFGILVSDVLLGALV